MDIEVKELAANLKNIICKCDDTECILMGQSAGQEVYDPNFTLTLDVYYGADIPIVEKRQKEYGNVRIFETSFFNNKDRFLYNDIPVHIEFKKKSRIDTFLNPEGLPSWIYMFFQIISGSCLWNRTDWIHEVKERLNFLPEWFWKNLRQSAQQRMEHYYSDMKAALMSDDYYYFHQALSGFGRTCCSSLFAVNRGFEPSARFCMDHLFNLDVLPSGFNAFFQILFNSDTTMDLPRKAEVAELITKKVFEL